MKGAVWMIDQLVEQGITQFCIAPGARSIPFITAIVEHPKVQTIVHFDERGLGFYALGYGKAAKHPAAIVVTSGSAVGNLLPSVMEAYHTQIPLIILTADRPTELRDCGNLQTCDQMKILAPFTRWQIDLPPGLTKQQLCSIVAQGVCCTLQNPPGPVQLNCQFREPLYPTPSDSSTGRTRCSLPAKGYFAPHLIPPPVHTDKAHGVILLGQIPCHPHPVLQLAKRLRWPVFADILSNARLHESFEQIHHFDQIMETHPELNPDFVLHFGNRLTSKKILDWPVSLHVSPYPFLQDPMRSLTHRVQCDIGPFCRQFTANTDPSWIDFWKKQDKKMNEHFEAQFKLDFPLTEAHALRQLSSILPRETAVFLANGMLIRDAQNFFFPHSCLGFFGNRGLSGIDGNIATAIGLSEGLKAPVVALIGDQAFLHDLNSLCLLEKVRYPITFIIFNNFGGGTFSHLPISEWPHFKTHIAATHNWTFEEAAHLFRLPYSSFNLERIFFENSAIIECITSRENTHHFRQICIGGQQNSGSRDNRHAIIAR